MILTPGLRDVLQLPGKELGHSRSTQSIEDRKMLEDDSPARFCNLQDNLWQLWSLKQGSNKLESSF